MIGSDFRSVAVQAVLGPFHAEVIPSVLWAGWLDAAGDLVAMSGERVDHAQFGPILDGVANTTALDLGVAGTGWTVHGVGLFADEGGTQLLVSAELDSPVSPTLGDPLVFDAGDLAFTIADPA